MAASNAVAERKTAVPDLVRTPSAYDDITAEDIALPRLYLGQFMSTAVQDGLVKAGTIYSATGQDDGDPQLLWSPETKNDPGVLFHVLSLRKGKSISDGGELTVFDYNDPDAPPEAWVTYTYTVVLPDVDADVPYKLLLTKTGRPAALQINTVIKKNSGTQPGFAHAFRLTTAPRENAKGKFFVARVANVPATPEHVELAQGLMAMIAGATAEVQATGAEPSI